MRNLNKRNILTSTEPINQTLGKKKVEKIILKVWVQYVPSSIKVGSFFLCNPRVKAATLVNILLWLYYCSIKLKRLHKMN
jgi:hypothetical protein